ncbi:MAG: glycosyltransferase family 4 protein [Methylobacteriaceae bacterium]|nr:glycosyltransferase family 4 protein [Methylobacteriaceae bacterium]
MRILQIVHGPEQGGVRTLADMVGEGLADRGYEIETAYLFGAAQPTPLAKLRGARCVASRILFGAYDGLLAYQASASILVGVAGWLARCPHRIVHQTALPAAVGAPQRWLDRLVGTLGLYTANVANSASTQAAFARYPARYRRAMVLIEHGVDAPKPARTRAATLAAFGIPDDRRVALNVGRLTRQKNQGVLIEALAALPSVRLVVAGEGPLRRCYESEAERRGVADRFHLIGEVSRHEIADLLVACDVFVFPSVWETFGIAAVEAVLAGTPIVAADIAVLREVLAVRGATAVFVGPDNPERWARALASSVPAARTEDEADMQATEGHYSVTRMIDAYESLLERQGAGTGRIQASTPRSQ